MMDMERLNEIEAEWCTAVHSRFRTDVLALVAEVRRVKKVLRDVLKVLGEGGTSEGEMAVGILKDGLGKG